MFYPYCDWSVTMFASSYANMVMASMHERMEHFQYDPPCI